MEPTIYNIGISTIANILVAIATFILALITYYTIKQMKKQMVFLQKQTLVAVAEQNPIIQIDKFKINNNKLIMTIRNIGKGNAYQTGIHSRFSLVKPLIKKRENGFSLVDFSYDPSEIMDKFRVNSPKITADNGYVNFISKKTIRGMILRPTEEIEICIEPEFFIRYSPKQGNLFGRIIKLDELINILKENNRQFVGLSFELVYKNCLEDMQDSVEVTEFIYDLKNHDSLENSAKSNYRPNYEVLSINKIQLNMGGIGYTEYKGMKSPKNYIPGENRKEL